MTLIVRKADLKVEADSIWAILEPIIRAGETYALPRNWEKEEALAYWCHESHDVFVVDDLAQGEIIGTYFFHANQKGGGNHVANCGFMTKSGHSSKGVARTMCAHSLQYAKEKGFLAMQYNYVVKTNERAVKLWQSMGMQIVGTLPQAFNHPVHGYTDVYVMYKLL